MSDDEARAKIDAWFRYRREWMPTMPTAVRLQATRTGFFAGWDACLEWLREDTPMPLDYEPDPESLEILGRQIRSALDLYHQARDGYLMLVPGPGDGPAVRRRIPKDVNLGPSPANPYVGAPPPLWASLPTRLPREAPSDWIRRCGRAAIEAALSVLASEDGDWQISNLPDGGWRVTAPGGRFDLHPGDVIR